MSQYTMFEPREAVVLEPRDPFREGIENIALVIEEEMASTTPNPFFKVPDLRKVYRGSVFDRPTFPCCDIRFVQGIPRPGSRTLGTHRAKWIWDLRYSVRYLHGILDPKVNETEVTSQLWALAALLAYNNDLHGFCGEERSKVAGVQQDISIFATLRDAGYIAGGAIIIDVPYPFLFSFFDHGQSPKEIVNPNGPLY